MPSEPSSPRQPQWFPTRGRHQRFCRLKLSGGWINSAEVLRGGGQRQRAVGGGGLAVAAAAASTRPHACATMRTGGDGVDGNCQGEIGFARCRPWWRAARTRAHFPAVYPPAPKPRRVRRRDSCVVETPDRGGHGECHSLCFVWANLPRGGLTFCFTDRRRQSGVWLPEMMVMGGEPPKQHWRSVGPGPVDGRLTTDEGKFGLANASGNATRPNLHQGGLGAEEGCARSPVLPSWSVGLCASNCRVQCISCWVGR